MAFGIIFCCDVVDLVECGVSEEAGWGEGWLFILIAQRLVSRRK